MTAIPLVLTFDFEEQAVRALSRDEAPWFVLADVARALGMTNPSVMVKSLDDDERAKFNLGRQGDANIISESGLYTLILRCDDAIKPGTVAYRFRKWVTAEVLPALRAQGSYSTTAEPEALPVRSELGKLRDLLMSSAEAVRDKLLDVGRAQQVANLAARYLEAIKIEGDYIGYDQVLGLRSGQASERLLRCSQQRPANEQVQGVLERGVHGAEEGEPELQGEAGGGEGSLAAGEQGAVPDARAQMPGEDDL